MNLTIQTVYPKAREFQSKYGPAAAIKVAFTDGTEGDVLTTPEKAPEHIERLTSLIGKPSDFDVDPTKEREYNGVTQRWLKGYPGKPEGTRGGYSGGGKGTFTPRYTDTREGFEAQQRGILASVALKEARELNQNLEAVSSEGILADADVFLQWLLKAAQVPAVPTQSAPTPAAAAPRPSPGHVEPSGGIVDVIWRGEGQCPKCHCPSGSKHGDKCLKAVQS